MLRKRSRAVGGKQGLMTDHFSLPSPTGSHSRPAASSLFPSPRLFVGLSPKGFSDSEAVNSPTSILETKPFTAVGNPFFSDRNPRKPLPEAAATATAAESRHHRPWNDGDPKPIGLGIVDALNHDKAEKKPVRPESRMVLFGSQLKIQIPSMNPSSIYPTGSVESPHSPIEFGIKNRDSQLSLFSPARKPSMGSSHLGPEPPASSPRVFTGSISPHEMELSEDYTCVISHGPNPRTTHIFDNCIVESCGHAFTSLRNESSSAADGGGYPSDGFLSVCHACKKNLGQGRDIFMYRGEKAFCSSECRYQEMLFDEGMEKCERCSSESPFTL